MNERQVEKLAGAIQAKIGKEFSKELSKNFSKELSKNFSKEFTPFTSNLRTASGALAGWGRRVRAAKSLFRAREISPLNNASSKPLGGVARSSRLPRFPKHSGHSENWDVAEHWARLLGVAAASFKAPNPLGQNLLRQNLLRQNLLGQNALGERKYSKSVSSSRGLAEELPNISTVTNNYHITIENSDPLAIGHQLENILGEGGA